MQPARPVKIDPSWRACLDDEFAQTYMRDLSQFLREEKRLGRSIYPAGEDIFAALNLTPVKSVKVVIIGQDPYHGAGQAHGLCFSVLPGTTLPPSLKNIYSELEADVGKLLSPTNGNLQPWAQQGVLLLNAVLTVEHGRAGSHQGKGWERFTDAIVATISRELEHVVFLLWGSYAQKKGAVVDRDRHCVLTAPHPSPLSAHRGFFGCRHFSKANAYLASVGKAEIDWLAISE